MEGHMKYSKEQLRETERIFFDIISGAIPLNDSEKTVLPDGSSAGRLREDVRRYWKKVRNRLCWSFSGSLIFLFCGVFAFLSFEWYSTPAILIGVVFLLLYLSSIVVFLWHLWIFVPLREIRMPFWLRYILFHLFTVVMFFFMFFKPLKSMTSHFGVRTRKCGMILFFLFWLGLAIRESSSFVLLDFLFTCSAFWAYPGMFLLALVLLRRNLKQIPETEADTPEIVTEMFRFRFRKRLICFLLLLFSFACVLGFYEGFNRILHHRADQTEKQLREEGLFPTPRQMAVKYPDSSAGKLAVWNAFLEEYKKAPSDGRLRDVHFNSMRYPSELNMRLDKEIKRSQPMFTALDRWLSLDHFQWAHEWEKGLFLELPHLQPLSFTSGMIALSADRAVVQKNMQEAKTNLNRLDRLYEKVLEEPLTISALAACGIFRNKYEQMRVWAANGTLSRFDDDYLRKEIRLSEKREARFRSEMRMFMSIDFSFLYRAFADGGITLDQMKKGLDAGLDTVFYKQTHLWGYDRIFFLEKWHSLLADAEKDYYMTEAQARPAALHRKHYILSMTALPSTANAFMRKASEYYAMERLLRTALALELCRRKNGHFPKQLNALVPVYLPKVPIDPFTGKELQMKSGEFTIDYWIPGGKTAVRKTLPVNGTAVIAAIPEKPGQKRRYDSIGMFVLKSE